MSLEIEYNKTSGQTRVKYGKHVLNALAIPLILSGFFSLSSPWWLEIVTGLLNKANIQINDNYEWLFAIIQIATGVGLLLFRYLKLDVWQRQKNMDISTVNELSLPIEDIRGYFKNLVDGHSYLSSKDTDFYNSYTTFLKTENSFQFKKLKKSYEQYSISAKNLHNFVGRNFFVFPDTPPDGKDYQYCLAPHLNMDRDLTFPTQEKVIEYGSLAKELHSYCLIAEKNFELFIADLKSVAL